MQFELSETQQLLKSSARKFLQAECPMKEVRRLMETATANDAGLWRQIAEQGWTGILFPEENDGMGLGMVETAAAMEEMGRALLPGSFLSTVLMAGVLVDAAGNADQKQRWLAPICRGEAKATVAMLEEDASWSNLDCKTRMDDLRITGRKMFVSDAGEADFLLIVAARDGQPVIAAVDRQAPGLTVEPMPALDHTRKLYSVTLEGVVVEAGAVLAAGDAARAAVARMFDVATAALCAEMLGGMQRLLEITVEYAKTRKQFGKPIGQFQAVQHQCADMFLMVESARSAAYYAAYALEHRLPEASLAVSIAKSYLSEAYRQAGNHAIQVHGGMGFTWESDLHLYYRRAKASEILFGDAGYHRERIARLVIGN